MTTPVNYLSIVSLILCCLPLWGCGNITKIQDCQKYELAMAKAANIPNIQTAKATDKKSFVALLNAIADNQQKMGEIINSVPLKDAKLQEIQKQTFIASNELANDFRKQTASIAALPGEPSLDEIRAAIKLNSQFQNNWVKSNDKYLDYCLKHSVFNLEQRPLLPQNNTNDIDASSQFGLTNRKN